MPSAPDRARPPTAPSTARLRARTAGHTTSGVGRLVDGLSLEQRIRQLLVLAVPSTSVTDVADSQAGGVIVMGHPDAPHLASRSTTLALTTRLQDAVRDRTGIGLLVAIDQEQGPVTRIEGPLSDLPGGDRLGATGDAGLARQVARDIGDELVRRGINLNFAPVADVNTNPANPVIGDRAFGDDAGVVSRLVTAQIAGYHEAGVAATAKHFPGHGAADVDSHVELPVVDLGGSRWQDVHLPPFRAAIDANVDAIMTAHVVAPALDAHERPATLSPAILTGLLRDQLGFDGVVVTDALDMAAVRHGRSDGQVAVAAVAAGADLLLMPPDPDAAVAALVDAVHSGSLPAQRVEAAARRVLELKDRLGLLD